MTVAGGCCESNGHCIRPATRLVAGDSLLGPCLALAANFSCVRTITVRDGEENTPGMSTEHPHRAKAYGLRDPV